MDTTSPEERIIQEYERFTRHRNVSILVEPIKAWPGHFGHAYQVTFTYDGSHDVMGLRPNSKTPVWDLYGRPSQVYRDNTSLLKDLEFIASRDEV